MDDDDMDLARMNETAEQRVFRRAPVVPFVTAPRTVALGMPPGYAEAIAAAVAKADQANETMPMGPITPGPALPFAPRAAVTPPVAVTPINAVSARAVVWRGAGVPRVTVIVKATFALTHNGSARWIAPLPIVETDRIGAGGAPGELAEASEIAPYVPTAAVLLSGSAHAPHGRPTAAMTVRLAVFREKALVDKQIHVFGDRDSPSSTPRPFTALPILASRPNFVDPRDPRRPSRFGPIAPTSPNRLRILGNVDPTTLDAPQPELVAGFDCQFFNAAPLDQQTSFLHGDEWIVLDGLHPTLPRVQTRLPSAVGKVRLNLGTPNGPGPSRDVGLVADMLVIDAEKMVCSLIWRGHVLLSKEEAASPMQVFAGLELPGQPIAWPEPRSPSWSEGALDETGSVQKFSRARASVESADVTGPVDVRQFRRAALPFGGSNPETPPTEPNVGAETGAVDVSMFRRAVLPFESGAARPAAILATSELLALLAEAPPAVRVEPPPAYVPAMQLPPPMLGLPPDQAVSPPEPEHEPEPEPEALVAVPLPAEAPAKASAVEEAVNLRQEILARLDAGTSLQGLSLGGADLQDFDFNGASLAGLDFTRANLRRTNLAGVQAAGIVLDGADLTEASFERADLSRANLSRAVVTRTCFDGATLTSADLQRISGDAPSFRGAKLQGADLRQASLSGANFDEAAMSKAALTKADLSGSRFVRADLSGANLRDCKLREADFSRANLDGADLRSADVSHAKLDGEARKTAKLTPSQAKSLSDNKP